MPNCFPVNFPRFAGQIFFHMWLLLAIASSLFLGVYDIFKKMSVNNNAVLPVLLFATLTGALLFTPFIILSTFIQGSPNYNWYIPNASFYAHFLFFIKAVIVASSWILAYFAMKNLPITIVTPIRASSPVWTLLGAIIIFAERLTLWQWIGLIITLMAYYAFSLAGKKEGISFRKNRWVLFIILATLIGAASSLYDKYLTANFDRVAMQAWFSVYLVVVLLPIVLIFWYPRRKKLTPFRWHWAIPLIGTTLVVADFLYFYALSYQDSLISLISVIRRGSVVTSFFLGAAIFPGERNIIIKGSILIFILIGIGIIILGS